jgi:predicted dehydrogenase
MNIGIIGCGLMGIQHARKFGLERDIHITAISDPSEIAREKLSADIGVVPSLSTHDYHELLDARLDAVCIASPDSFHVPQIIDSLQAGLHVLCEKPLTSDPEELNQLIEATKKSGRVVMGTYPRRLDTGARTIRQEILSGRWGKVQCISIYNCEDWITPNVGTWRHNPAICPGGFFFDANQHQIDTCLWMTGLEPVSAHSQWEDCGMGVPIRIRGEALLHGPAAREDGVPATFHTVGDAKVWQEQVNIHCENMDFMVENFRYFWVKENMRVSIASPGAVKECEAVFLRCIKGEIENPSPPDSIWPVLRFMRMALHTG